MVGEAISCEKRRLVLLKINPHLKMIVSSGHFLDARERLLLGVQAKGFVNKPYEVGQLVHVVKGVLEA